MRKVAAVTDSSASVPAELAQELGSWVVPIPVRLGGRAFRCGIDITGGDVCDGQVRVFARPRTRAKAVADGRKVGSGLQAEAHRAGAYAKLDTVIQDAIGDVIDGCLAPCLATKST